MPRRLRYEYSSLSYEYPDNESSKEVFFQASGLIASHLRTILIYWINHVFLEGQVWQVVRLNRHDDRYKYVYPDLIVVDASASEGGEEGERERTMSLGVFSRDEREALLECADEIEYEERLVGDEGQCLRWMGRLLERMVEEGLVGGMDVDKIRESVPIWRSNPR